MVLGSTWFKTLCKCKISSFQNFVKRHILTDGFSAMVHVHCMQLLSAFVILKPWGSTWQNPFFFGSALLSFCQVSALLKSHTIKKLTFSFLLLGVMSSFEMNNICKIELHIFIRPSHPVKEGSLIP